MNQSTIIMALENMVVVRLFSGQRWLADQETRPAIWRKLLELGLWECISVETGTWGPTTLGKELDAPLFDVFLGMREPWEIPNILEEYHLINEMEADSIYSRMEKADAADAGALLGGYVKRAYFEYRKAIKFLH